MRPQNLPSEQAGVRVTEAAKPVLSAAEVAPK